MLELQEPFPVRIPEAIRHMGGPMEVDTVSFDGTVVRVAYRKSSESGMGWWFAATTHEFLWLPDVQSSADVIEHYFRWLADEYPTESLTEKHLSALRDGSEVIACGRGHAVYLSPDTVGLRIPGGKNHIYLISEDGTRGTLRIPDGAYQSYVFAKCEIGPNQRVTQAKASGKKRRHS